MYTEFIGRVWNYLQNIEKYTLDSVICSILELSLSKCLGRIYRAYETDTQIKAWPWKYRV